MSMRLGGVQLKEYDPENAIMKDVLSDFKDLLEKYPLRFSFQDGVVEQLCLTGEEPTWVLNAKRGIISLIQNNMEDFKTNHTTTETDVTGVCNTEYYTGETGWYTTTVRKSKNLLGCTERHGYNTAVQAVPYTAQSSIQSLPLLKSDHNCKHEIDTSEGYLKSVTCEEQHVFRPFSNANSGALTSNKQTLTFVRVTPGTKRLATIKSAASLKFDHVYDVDKETKDRKDLTRKLLEICEKTKAGVRPETPKLFTDLVFIMKTADATAIDGIYKMLKEEKICSDNLYRTTKYFLDALPIAGTSATLRLMTELITSNAVTGLEADMWLTSLSFIKNPTAEMLKSVKPLINMPAHTEKAMLSVGTMVHSYCVQTSQCDDDEMVKAIISTFVNKMATGCKVKDSNIQTTLMALRGIGNAGFASSAIPKLEVCMRVKQNPTEVRLSAIEAFRRMPCDSSRKALMDILTDTEEDSEIRIAAYKVLMECPSEEVLRLVRQTLANEEVNQVGSYIWTHLTNLMETSDRHKQDLRTLLEDETFKKEFDLDKRKFSRNYEGSVFIDQINTGAKAEGDLIWSSKSFIPRAGMVNLTFDLFGHSVNLFELGGRAEGLEYFFESFFGPNGYFKTPEAEAETSTNDLEPLNIDNKQIQKIDKRFSAQAADLRASMYMRVFGNELRYMNIRGMDSILAGSDFNLLDMLIKFAEDNDYTYSHSIMFLDSSFIVPTASGFPLNLTVNGTATLDLRLKGKMDLRRLPSVDINGLIQPSAAIDISSMMSVDAFVTKSGVKMISTLHTSTAVQGALKIDEKGSMTSEFEMPDNKMEIFDVRSSFFTVHRDTEKEQKMPSIKRKFVDYCSPSKLVTITGLELCAAVDYPVAEKADSPYFPLTGPANAGIYLYKRDIHTKYTMAAKSMHNKFNNIIKFTFDTPGSRTDRHVNIDINLDKKDMSLGMSLESPWKRFDMSGKLSTDSKKSGVSGVMKMDGKYPYSFTAMLEKQRKGNTYTWTPSISIDISKQTKISLTGSFSNTNWRQIDLSYEAEGFVMIPPSAKVTLLNKPALAGIQGSLDLAKDKQYSIDFTLGSTRYPKKVIFKPLASVRTPEKEVVSFGGTFGQYFGKGVDSNLVLDIDGLKQTSLKGKFMAVKKGRRTIYNNKLAFFSSPFDLAVDGKVDNKNGRTIATNFDIKYNLKRIIRDRFTITSKIFNLSASKLTKGRSNIIYQSKNFPAYSFRVKSELEHDNKHTEFENDISFGSDFKNADKQIEFRYVLNKNMSANSGNFLTKFKFPYMSMSMLAKGDHSHDNKNINSNLYVKVGKNEPVETSLKVQDKTGELIKVTSEFKLTSGWSNIGLGLELDQSTIDTYVSNMKMDINKRQNIITTIVQPDEDGGVAIDSDIKLFNQSSLRLLGDFRLNPTDFKTELGYEKDNKKYAVSFTSATEMGKSSWLNADLMHPKRRILISVGGKSINDVLHGSAEMKWNADINDNDRVAITGWIEPVRSDRINGSISFSYPSRTLELNVHHIATAKYTSHADFQWAPDMKIQADTVIGFNTKTFNGNAKLLTPFSALPKLNLGLTYNDNDEEYNTLTSVTWGESDTLTLESYIKKPISLNTLVGSMDLKSSIKDIRSVRLVADHKLSTSLASSIDFKWNKQSIKADVVVQNTSKGAKIGYDGTLNLQTTYKFVKKGSLNLAFDSNGKTHNAKINIKRNRKIYSMLSTMTHAPDVSSLSNTGSITLKSPLETYMTRWDHRYTSDKLYTSVVSSWGKSEQISAVLESKFGGAFDTILTIETPFKIMKTARVETGYTLQYGSLDSKLAIHQNEELIGMTTVNYNIDASDLTALYQVSIPKYSVDSQISAQLSLNELKMKVIAVITPTITLGIEGSSTMMQNSHSMSSELLWKSSIPDYEQVKLSHEVNDGDFLTSTSTLEYGTGQSVQLETKFAFTRINKHVSATLKTPFEILPFAQGGFDMQGDLDSVVSEVYVEAQPALSRKSVSYSMNTQAGFESKLVVDASARQVYSLTTTFNEDKVIVGKAILSTPGRRDIVVSFSHEAGLLDNVLIFEVEHNRKNAMNAKLKVSTDGTNYWKVSSTGSLRFECISETEQYAAGFDYEGHPMAFSSNLEFTNSNNGTSSLQINTDFENSIEGNIVIKSPFITNIKASFKHDQSDQYLRSNINIMRGLRNIVDLQANLNSKDSLIANFNLKTPVLRDINFMTKLDGHLDNFVILTESSYGKNTIDVELRSMVGPEMLQQKLTVQALGKDGNLEFNHNKGIDSFKTFVECNIGTQRHRADISFNRKNDIEGTFELESPLVSPVSATILFKGQPSDFSCHATCNIDVDRSSIDLSASTQPSFSSQLNLRSPYVNDVSLNLNYAFEASELITSARVTIEDLNNLDVSMRATENTFNAQYTFGELKSVFDSSISTTNPLTGRINIQSHLFPTISVQYRHEGVITNFLSHAEYAIGTNKTEIDITFEADNDVKGFLQMQSYLTPRILVEFSHSGVMNEFNTKGKMTYGLESRDAELKVKLTNNIEVKATYNCPLHGQSTVALLHSYDPTSFATHVELVSSNTNIEGDLQMKAENRKLSCKASLKTLDPSQNIDFSFDFSGVPRNMNMRSNLIFGSENVGTEINHRLTSSRMESTFTLTSSFIDDISATLNAEQTANKVSSNVLLTNGPTKSTGSFSAKVIDDSLASSFELLTPFTTAIRMNIEHNGMPSNFNTKYNAFIGEENFNGQFKLNVEDKIEGSFKLNKPDISFDASASKTEVNANILFNRDSYTALLKYPSLATDNIILEGKVTSPFAGFRHVVASYEHNGSLRNIQCNGRISVEGEDSISEFKLDTQNLNNIKGSLSVSSPYMPDIDVQLSNVIKNRNYNGICDVQVDNEKLYGYKLAYSSDPRIEGTVEIISPYNAPIKITFDSARTTSSIESNAEVLFGNKKTRVESSIQLDTTKGTLSLERMGDKYSVEGSVVPGEIMMKISNKESDLFDSSLKYKSQLVDFKLKSTVPHDLSMVFYLSKTESSFASNIDLTHNNNNILNGRADYTTSPFKLQGSGNINFGVVQSTVSLLANDDVTAELNAGMDIYDDKWSFNAKYEDKQDVDASFSISMPDRDEIMGMFKHDGKRFKSGTSIKLQLDSLNTIDIQIDQQWRNAYIGTVSIKSPLDGYELTRLQIKNDGSFPNVKSSGELLFAEDTYSVSLDMSNMDSMKADFVLKTPFEMFRDISLKMHSEGDINNFKTGGQLMYTTGKMIELQVEHSFVGFDLNSKVELTSPFTEAIVLTLDHNGTPTSFTSSYKLASGNDNSISSVTTMNIGQRSFSLSNVLENQDSGEKFQQKLDIKHDGGLDNFRTEVSFDSLGYQHRLDASFKLDPVVEGSLELVTPYEHFTDIRASFSHKSSANGILSLGEVTYAPNKVIKGKVDVQNYYWKNLEASVELNTPFDDLKANKIQYQHNSLTNGFNCLLDAFVYNEKISGKFATSMDPLNTKLSITTPIEGFEDISFHASLEKMSASVEAKWNPKSAIVVNSEWSKQGGRITITSPFKQVEHLSLSSFKIPDPTSSWKQGLTFSLNGKAIIDADVQCEFSYQQPYANLEVRTPRPMKFEVEGDFDMKNPRAKIFADWNSNDDKSSLEIAGTYNIKNEKTFALNIVQPKMLQNRLILQGELTDKSSSGKCILGDQTYGYHVEIGHYERTVRIILPTRTLELSGFKRGSKSELSFMWDASVDQTKKVAITSNTFQSRNLLQSDISISLPSFEKNVQLESKISLDRGNVLFEGTTELTYSKDSRKKITLFSKLEDISTYGNKNYSFSVGVSHPYSTIDMTLNSHLGQSDDKYSAGVGMEYLTATKQKKKFQIDGTLDKIKKTISLELFSPVKTISISGSAQTGDKWRLSLLNAYDESEPLHSYLTVDPSSRKVDFSMNYDLDQPKNEFSFSARYVNSSAVAFEVFHTESGARITDILTTARLNTSHLLHSRIHWRPEMIQDLKSFLEKKQMKYEDSLKELENTIRSSLLQEIRGKFRLIVRSIEDQIGKDNKAISFELVNMVQTYIDNYRQPSPRSKPTSQEYRPLHVSAVSKVDDEYLPIRETVVKSFNSVHDGIKTVSQQIPQLANKGLSNTKILGLMNTLGLDEVLEMCIKEYVYEMEQKLEAGLYNMETIILSYLKSPFTVYDPEHGEIQIELYSILPLESLDKIPAIDYIKYMEEFNTGINDYVDRNTPDFDLLTSDEWVPPFAGKASITNGRQITTFDGYMYELDVDCKYILTRDYQDGNFTFVLTNGENTMLTILTSGRPISINSQGQVLRAGEPVELPITEGYVTATKDDSGVHIKGGNHFNIDYDTSIDHIDITLSGWYYGKTGGLLGTFDNEPSNDRMTSFGKVIPDSSRVAKTWTVSSDRC
ncbi:hypothetical protein ACF0H5_004338 [Mactra antiquata]